MSCLNLILEVLNNNIKYKISSKPLKFKSYRLIKNILYKVLIKTKFKADISCIKPLNLIGKDVLYKKHPKYKCNIIKYYE